MGTNYNTERELLSHPGETLKDILEERGMSQAEFAERIGRPKEKINDIIKGRDSISTSTAFKFEQVLGTPADFWINREANYRKELYRIERNEKLEKWIEWSSKFPIKNLKEFGILPKTKDKLGLVSELLKFFEVASPEEWNRIYLHQEEAVSFRISLVNAKSPHAISTWLRIGEIKAKSISLSQYNKKGFKRSLYEAKQIAYEHPSNFHIQLSDLCAKFGVALVFVPNIKKAPVSGAARWYQNIPIIQLSGRHKTNDHFWFSFFHEAGHILLHGKKEVFIEDAEGLNMNEKKEKEADDFASKILLSHAELSEITTNFDFNIELIKEYSEKFKTPAGVILGRLQHMKLLPFSKYNQLKRKVMLFS